jgi:hypothetical protein
LLLLPALANAHDHGRGLRCMSYGAVDQPLETWLPALYEVPRNDPYLSTTASLCRLARSGVGSVASCHAVQQPEPWQNPYVERLIGSIRRECLDHIIIFNESHLRSILSGYFQYHHWTRTHLSLDKYCPQPRRIQPASAGNIIAFPEVGGLHHRYERRADRRTRFGVKDRRILRPLC